MKPELRTHLLIAGLALTMAGAPAQVASPQTAGNAAIAVPPALPASTAYHVVGRGANHKDWQRETYERGPQGQVVTHIHKYTELANGLHYKNSLGQWAEAQEQITAFAGGAIAQPSQYQVIFANNLNSAGAIDQQTPDGKRLRSNIIGLGYYDHASGQSVLIAQVKDSQGELIAANQVLYPNAFNGVNADVRYTYKKGSFEQDVILRAQPPAPETYGLSSATTELEVMTELIQPPSATLINHTLPQVGVVDQDISWGTMRLGHGKAFDLGDQQNPAKPVVVHRRYLTQNGRTILLETVPLPSVQAGLQKLPLQSSTTAKLPALAAQTRQWPQTPPARTDGRPMKLAAATPSNQGYVLDYVEIVADTEDITFAGDTTYYISAAFGCYGTLTLEGGTVLKFAPYAYIWDVGGLACATGPYRPAVLTDMNDDTVGETIAGSSGTPVAEPSAVIILDGDMAGATTGINVHDVRFCYLDWALGWYSETEGPYYLDLWNCQFLNCNHGTDLGTGLHLGLHNILYRGPTTVLTATAGRDYVVTAEQVTADVTSFGLTPDPAWMTNSIVLESSGPTATIISDSVITTSPTRPLFQTVGAGSYYLTNGSPYRQAGTPNISPAMLTELSQKTTWPPQVYASTTLTTALTLNPCVPRDSNPAPDLGYHYDPLDYAFGNVSVATNLTLTAGTAAGWFEADGAMTGIFLNNGGCLNFQGTATAPCNYARYCLVQEGGNGNWTDKGYLGGVVFTGSNPANPPALTANFTRWQMPAGGPCQFLDYWAYGVGRFSNCELYGGNIGSFSPSYYFTNCLFYRVNLAFWAGLDAGSITLQNCTYYNGGIALCRYSGQSPSFWNIQNTAFDGTACLWADNFNGATNHTAFDYNAYNTANTSWQNYPGFGAACAGTLATVGPDDVTVTGGYNWQSSWLGNFYLPPDSALIDAGSPTADRVGLSEYTTQTSQVKEGSSPVDIGYHYVAVDPNTGQPEATLVAGEPDYLADANGNGLPDAWEYYWFGNYTNTASELDAYGNTLLADYYSQSDPNVINFTIEVANNYVNRSSPTMQLNVTAGTPSAYAVLVDSTNFAGASWPAYTSSTVTAALGSLQGWHEIWVGLRGPAANATVTWQWKRLKLDTTPPALVITGPTTSTVTVPLIQLQGFSPEPLDRISYDLSNALGLVTNLEAGITSQYYDTDTWDFTTNYFEALDIPLTNGVNTVIIHATDLAGNVTTLTTNYTLDYTGAANPVVQLTWPQNGMELCGNSFTLRGTVDDPLAIIAAAITDTNGNTSLVAGEVERTGVLWVENLPLAEGTNWLTLSVTNAAGLSNTTNLCVVKNDMTLCVTNIDGDLWQATVNVSGLISPYAGYAVWVNGVPGTNHGDGSWSAANVPVSAGGVASFDLSAVNGGDPASNTNLDKPVRLYQKSYACELHSEINPDIPANDHYPYYETLSGLYDETLHWTNRQSGADSSFYNQTDSDLDPFDPHITYSFATNITTWPASGVPETSSYYQLSTIVASSYTDGPGIDSYFKTNDPASDAGGFTFSEHCQVKAVFDDAGLAIYHAAISEVYPWSLNPMGSYWKVAPYTRTADTVWELQTGGKAMPQRQNLFCLSGSAQEVTDRLAWRTTGIAPTPDIPPQNIMIDGMALGNDGNQWRTYADNDTRDVTPRVKNKDFYRFTVNQQEYKPVIGLTTSTTNANLETDMPEVCVGQNVKFTLQGVPDEVVNMVGGWSLPTKYVNEMWQNQQWVYTDPVSGAGYWAPYGSENYRINSSLLANTKETSCWYVNGQGGHVSVGLNLKFQNGQYASVAANGNFTVVKPKIVGMTNLCSGVNMFTNVDGSLNEIGLNFQAGNNGANGVEIAVFVKRADQFQGLGFITQLVNRRLHWNFYLLPVGSLQPSQPIGVPWQDTTGGTYWLDGSDPYPGSEKRYYLPDRPYKPDHAILPVKVSDGPYLAETPYGFYDYAEGQDDFQDYIRFQPDGNGSIPVTIGRVDWGWHGKATKSGGAWSLVVFTNYINQPDTSDDSFPVWLNTYSGTKK